jgi:hypothetical protein
MYLIKGHFLVLLICGLSFAALDSATVVNGINNAGTIANLIAQASGRGDLVGLIGSIVGSLIGIASFIFGHKHGRNVGK